MRFASWDLGHVYLADERTGAVLCRLYPLDKQANADGQRRSLEPLAPALSEETPAVAGGAAALEEAAHRLRRDGSAAGVPAQRRGRKKVMNKKLLSLFGLKWNPFSPDVPVEALLVTPRIESFCWRVENLAREGGFALVTGAPGAGKSVALRLLVERLTSLREVKIGVMSRPQGGVADFYRELGDLFGVQLSPHNRWAGAKLLRERWQAHIDAALFRPLLVVDEAQDTPTAVLNEMRHQCAARASTLTRCSRPCSPGMGGSSRSFAPMSCCHSPSRMRVKLALDRATPEELAECLRHCMTKSGLREADDRGAGSHRVRARRR